jgi:hypothetical protein
LAGLPEISGRFFQVYFDTTLLMLDLVKAVSDSFPSAIRVSMIGKFTAAFEKVVKRSRRSQAALLALKTI